MKMTILHKSRAAALGIVASLGMTVSIVGHADNDGPFGGLAGTVFVVRAEIVASIDPDEVGFEFDNCYYFDEDGIWVDPLYPVFDFDSPGAVGLWVQHTDRPKISYTATVANQDETPGMLLIQNGTVTPGPANGKKAQVVAYTTVYSIDGENLPLVEVKSVGVGMDTCPFF
ncbi:MAG: hypothetical protein WBS20_11270 [Lysobacterales bacterium]